ncbi:hypothetical protein V3C99_014864, partial [Haemonchus contortus]
WNSMLLHSWNGRNLDNVLLRSVQRPITLLPLLYNVFTRCILARIRRTLEEAQSVEQAGFRRNFSTLDHIATCRRLIEASREHRLPLVMTFIGYKKAFDSVEPVKVLEALEEQGIERIYVDVLRECYSHCTTVFHLSTMTL